MLLIAPTGAGKTLAGFLPAWSISRRGRSASRARRIAAAHALYLAAEGARGRHPAQPRKPVAEMGLPISLETRTGDTPVYKRQRQKLDPPDILLTTPEQVALLLASKDARRFFADLR